MQKDSYGDEKHPLAFSLSVNRRDFLKKIGVLGGGILVYFKVGDPAAWAQRRGRGFFESNQPDDFNAFLRIGTDGKVTCLTGKIEMGQGVVTSLPQMLAEELDVSYEAVDIIMGDTDLCPWDMGTFGSMTTRFFGPTLLNAAREARGVLMELGADYLKVPVDKVQTKKGVVFDRTRPKNRVNYGQLTRGKLIERRLRESPPPKKPSEYKVMGKPQLSRDAEEKVTGKAKYAGDIRLPGMLYAKILRPPAHGARLKNVDTRSAEKIKGIQVIQDGELIAVLHKHPDEAEKALAEIKAQFLVPKTGIDDKNIFEHLIKKIGNPGIVSNGGDLRTGERLSSTIIEETYLNSYVSHAPMETRSAIAKVEGNKTTVWASTQGPFRVQQQVAGALNIPTENVHIITPFVGGGFGGKTSAPQAVEAARLSKLTGRPVQVVWDRQEEFFYDSFRPAAVVKIKSGFNDAGKIMLWDYLVSYAGQRGSDQFYEIPHHREASYGGWGGWGGPTPGHPFAVGPWRAPAANTNTYARELHLNLMASKASIDPLEFRLRHLKDKRMIEVLKRAAKKFGWKPSKTPSGQGHGIACSIYGGTYLAFMAAVDVDKVKGTVEVKRIVCVQDMGFVVNPEGARLQMEGCITMGLGYALTEEIRFKDGEIFDTNFDTYDIPRFSWLPKIETVLIDYTNLPPQGGGEPAITGMGAVLASAVFDATGAKLLQLPMTPSRVKEAIENLCVGAC